MGESARSPRCDARFRNLLDEAVVPYMTCGRCEGGSHRAVEQIQYHTPFMCSENEAMSGAIHRLQPILDTFVIDTHAVNNMLCSVLMCYPLRSLPLLLPPHQTCRRDNAAYGTKCEAWVQNTWRSDDACQCPDVSQSCGK